jgi:hypothetical protein
VLARDKTCVPVRVRVIEPRLSIRAAPL